MKPISLLQQTCLVVGNSVVMTSVAQAFWNNRTIKTISLSFNLAGLIISVGAIASATIGIMLTFTRKNSHFQNEETTNKLYCWLKDGAVLATISGWGIFLI